MFLSTTISEFELQNVSTFETEDNISSQKLIEKIGLRYLKTKILTVFIEKMRYYSPK